MITTTKATDDHFHWTSIDVGYMNEAFQEANMTQLHFWQMSDKCRFTFSKNFCNLLFDTADHDLLQLSKKLDISYPYVCHLRRGMYSIPNSILNSLSLMSGISLTDIEKNIFSVRTRHGICLNIKFPILTTARLASLVGHVYGDGYVGNQKRSFEYSNIKTNLINQVTDDIKELFGIFALTERFDRIGYPSIIGEVLERFGAPIAPKIYSRNQIPSWILEDEKCKIAFVKAFFDDGGSVMYSKNYNSKGINLYVIRHENVEKECIDLLKQIKDILSEFLIYSVNPIIAKRYKKAGGKRIIAYINITDMESIKNYHGIIGLTDGDKSDRLERIIERKVHSKAHHKRLKAQRVISFLRTNRVASTARIADYIHINKTSVLKLLKSLDKKKILKIVGKVSVNRSYLWELEV